MFNLPRPVSLGLAAQPVVGHAALAVLEFNPEMPASDRTAVVAMWWRLRRRHGIDLPAQPGVIVIEGGRSLDRHLAVSDLALEIVDGNRLTPIPLHAAVNDDVPPSPGEAA